MNFSYWEKEYLLNDIDFLIVGMGLTGLQSAIEIKLSQPKANVVVVDRYGWSLGASTRNAGFACFANVSELLDDLENSGENVVFQLAADRYNGLKRLRENFGDNAIGYFSNGSAEVFDSKTKPDLEKGLDYLRYINTQCYEAIGLDDVFEYSSHSHFPDGKGCFNNKFEGQLNTGMLYQSVLQKARRLDIQLLGGLELDTWETQENGVYLSFTSGFEVIAKQLILCTNAFTSKWVDEDIEPARGQVIVSEKLTEIKSVGLHHYDKGYYYWRDIDGRILLGGARNMDKEAEKNVAIETNPTIVEELHRFMKEQICGHDVKIDYQWSGIMAMGKGETKDPIIKSIKPNVWIAARLGGMGVALSSQVALKLKDKILGDA